MNELNDDFVSRTDLHGIATDPLSYNYSNDSSILYFGYMKLNSYFTHCIVHNIYIDHINTLFGGQTSTENGPAIGSMN